MISSWVLTTLVVTVIKSVTSAFKTGDLLFRPRICLESLPSWLALSSRIIILVSCLVVTLLSMAFLEITSSWKVNLRAYATFLAALYYFQAHLSFVSDSAALRYCPEYSASLMESRLIVFLLVRTPLLGSEDGVPVVNSIPMSLYLRRPRSGAVVKLGQLSINFLTDLVHFCW